MKPNFLIVGVARCGTTSLFHYLNQHPDIGFPKMKEPKFFSSKFLTFPHNGTGDNTVDNKVIKDESAYYQLFEDLQKYKKIGEASSDYFYFHEYTIPAIKESLGDIPIIILIRNPIERSYSAYNNLVRDNREKLPFQRALEEEEERVKNNWDWMWHYKRGSIYSTGIRHFKDSFSKVKVVLYDNLKKDPNKITKDVFNFLGVSTDLKLETSITYSPSGKIKNKLIATLIRRDLWLTNLIRNVVFLLIPRSILEKRSQNLMQKQEIDQNITIMLKAYFENDIKDLEVLLDENLNHWIQ